MAISRVVKEVQPSLVNGSGGQFVELYNPSATEAVDLSGWTLSGSVTATIQPGTVIVPHGTMTFVANDPAFRACYGGLVFAGGTFTGSLARPAWSRCPAATPRSPTPSPSAARAGPTRRPAVDGPGGPDVRQLARIQLGVVSAPITAYEVNALLMSSTAANATVVGISTFPVLGPTIRSKVLTLTPGIYRFQVVALNAVGLSPSSAMSNPVTAQ